MDHQLRPPGERPGFELQPPEAREQALEGDPGLQPRERRPEAEVGAGSEADVPGPAPVDVELVRPREHGRVPVGRVQHQVDPLPGPDRRPAVLQVLAGQPEDHLHRPVHPQQLLHRVRDPLGLCPEARRQGRVADEPQHAARDEVGGGLVPREEDEHEGVDDLVVAQVRPVAQQELGEVVAGRPAVLLHQGVEARRHRPRRPRRAAVLRLVRGVLDVAEHEAPELVRPVLELLALVPGHPEELGDDDGRQRVGEVGDEVHPPLRPERVQELVHHRPHVRFEPGNVPREERVLHRPPELPMAGRVVEHHPVRQGPGEERDVRVALAAAAVPLEPAHLLDRQPRVEEGAAHVRVAGQDPAAERGAPVRRRSFPQAVVDRVRVVEHRRAAKVGGGLGFGVHFLDLDGGGSGAPAGLRPRADVERRSGTRRVSRTGGAGTPAGCGSCWRGRPARAR